MNRHVVLLTLQVILTVVHGIIPLVMSKLNIAQSCYLALRVLCFIFLIIIQFL